MKTRRLREPPATSWLPGFTLTELLVVIGVLALLAALLLPVLARMRDRARTTTCLAHVRQIALAHLLYVQDWDEHLPGWWQPGPSRPKPFLDRSYWTELLQPYLHSQGVLRDPAASPTEQSVPGLPLADYALLTWGPDGTGSPDSPYWRHPGPPLRLGQVTRPAETMSVTDGITTTEITRGHVPRHQGGIVAGFLDGSARRLTPARAFEVMYDPKITYYRGFAYRLAAADR